MTRLAWTLIATLLCSAALAGCTSDTDTPADPTPTHATATPTATPTVTPTKTPTTSPFPEPKSTADIAGSGSTFMKPLMETWAIEYAKAHSKVHVSYGGGGSGKGISDITAKATEFGASDAPLSATEQAAASGILQIPATLGVVAIVYNVDGVADHIKLDGETLGKIFTGAINRWNHDDIKALNPGVSFPDAQIAIVYRADSSGTTFVTTDYLSKASTSWASTMGSSASKKPDWTKSSAKQLSGNGNDGVGGLVKSTPNSIGYVELAYRDSLALKSANLKSHDGEYLAPSAAGATAAATALATNLPTASGDWSKVSLVNAPGAGSYPISTFAYVLVYGKFSDYGGQITADQYNGLLGWLNWAIHDGQNLGPALGYAKLPASVVKIGEDALKGISPA